MILFNLGAGSFSNLKNVNFVGRFLGWISPMRYACELLFRRLISERFYKDFVFDEFSYNYGEKECYLILCSMTVLFFSLGWAIVYFKSRIM